MSLQKIHKQFIAHRTLLATAATILALVLAIIYYVVVPPEAASTSGLQHIILRYGHSLCWILLAAASGLQVSKDRRKLSAYFAYAALAAYIAFFMAIITTSG